MAQVFMSRGGIVLRFKKYVTGAWCDCLGGAELCCIVTANGHKQYRLRCITCDRCPQINISHSLLSDDERNAARVLRTNEPTPEGTCARCGTIGVVEVHHWAPQALFEDANYWPQDTLCRPCHLRWHQAMNPNAS